MDIVSSKSRDSSNFEQLESLKRELRSKAFQGLRAISRLGELLRILDSRGFGDQLLEPENIWERVYDPELITLLIRLRIQISQSLPAIVYYLLTIRHVSKEDLDFLRSFYQRYAQDELFMVGVVYLLLLIEEENPWIMENEELYRLYIKLLQRELRTAKLLLGNSLFWELLSKTHEDKETRLIRNLQFVFFNESRFKNVKNLEELRKLLAELTQEAPVNISILGNYVQQLLRNPSLPYIRKSVELAFEPALYELLYYYLISENPKTSSEKRFLKNFLERYVSNEHFRIGLKFLLKTLLCKESLRLHPAVRLLAKRSSFFSWIRDLLKKLESES
jgi:hypothetical protein